MFSEGGQPTGPDRPAWEADPADRMRPVYEGLQRADERAKADRESARKREGERLRDRARYVDRRAEEAGLGGRVLSPLQRKRLEDEFDARHPPEGVAGWHLQGRPRSGP